MAFGQRGTFPEDQGSISTRRVRSRQPPGGYYAPFRNPRLEDKPDDHYLTDRLTDESIAFLDQRNQSQPFFIYLAYYTVHTPIQGCDQYDDYFRVRNPKGDAGLHRGAHGSIRDKTPSWRR